MTGLNASMIVSKDTRGGKTHFLHVCLDWRETVKVSQKQKKRELMETGKIGQGGKSG